MLISKTVKLKWNGKTKKYYESKGYKFTKYKDEFEVKVEDLTRCCHVKVQIRCDNCGKKSNISWQKYKEHVHTDEKCYCLKYGNKLFGITKMKKTKLKNTKSFKQWCIDNNRQDILNQWDYELNKINTDDIAFGTNKKYWFKCSKGIHESELKSIGDFTNGHDGVMDCKKCNSFAQWGIDHLGEDFLDKYWDYDKNTVDPWKISYGSKGKKVYIYCQKHKYHGSYDIKCNSFANDNRCIYCTGKKVHPLDSLGQYIIDNYGKEFLDKIWSDKNKKSPFDYSPNANQKAWWKCSDGKHKDYKRSINSSNRFKFRCPECGYSQGENRISNYLIKNKINYISQKEFNGLIGVGNGNLSYDFHLFNYNLLIEYDGEFHYKPIKGIKQLKIQKEHDKRKTNYAKEYNIKLLRIPYWDFDNIESILEKELQPNNIENSEEVS